MSCQPCMTFLFLSCWHIQLFLAVHKKSLAASFSLSSLESICSSLLAPGGMSSYFTFLKTVPWREYESAWFMHSYCWNRNNIVGKNINQIQALQGLSVFSLYFKDEWDGIVPVEMTRKTAKYRAHMNVCTAGLLQDTLRSQIITLWECVQGLSLRDNWYFQPFSQLSSSSLDWLMVKLRWRMKGI